MIDKEKLFELPFSEIVAQYARGYDEVMEDAKAEPGNLTLKYLFCIFTAYVPFHREYIRRNLNLWKN